MKRFRSTPFSRISLAKTFAVLWLGSSMLLAPASAAMFSASIDPALYGNLDQDNVPGIGGCACAPTSVVNSLVFLQNEAPHIYGDNTLLPHSETPIPQEEMADVATILAGDDFMATTLNGGTYIEDFIFGKVRYIEERAPGKTRYAAQVALDWREGEKPMDVDDWPTHAENHPQPDWVQDETAVTLDFLYRQIRAREDVEIFLEYDTGGAHYLTITGIMYDDTDNTGKLNFIDPLGGMPGMANITGLDMGIIQIDYGGGASVFHAVSESPIPEPQALVLAALALCGLTAMQLRRRWG